jgi:hypothetical protein
VTSEGRDVSEIAVRAGLPSKYGPIPERHGVPIFVRRL